MAATPVRYPTDEELRAALRAPEDNLVERKTEGDTKDVLKTVVGFANSVEIGRVGILLVGVRNDGTIVGVRSPDETQKSLNQKIALAYPRIDYQTRVLAEGAASILCVLVPGSENRPHFAGPAYVRVGSQTIDASEAQYRDLVADHSVKVRRLRSLIGKQLRTDWIKSGPALEINGRISHSPGMTMMACGAFNVTLRDNYGTLQHIALDRVHLLEEPDIPGSVILEIRTK
jgi:hypothetical protein